MTAIQLRAELFREMNPLLDSEVAMTKVLAFVKNLVVAQKEESDLESLFSFGETTALQGDIKGLDDFELICFLVIRE